MEAGTTCGPQGLWHFAPPGLVGLPQPLLNRNPMPVPALPSLQFSGTFLVLMGLCTSSVPAQTAAPGVGAATPVVAGEHITVRSAALAGEEREAWILLPRGYEAQPQRRYDVLYVLDGGAIGPIAASINDYLVLGNRVPPIIVVGVDSKNGPDRARNFTPVIDQQMKDRFPTAGGADAFLRYLGDELVPAIDQRYRASPRRYLMGHSLGGLFALHVLASRPALFQGYLALSPSTRWADGAVLRSLAGRFAEGVPDNTFLYMSAAKGEDMPQTEALFRDRAPASLRWRFVHYENDDHFTTVPPALHAGLLALFAAPAPMPGR